MEFSELVKKRYSARKYKPKKVEREKLLKILEAGRVAPTANNSQPQRLLVLEKEESLEKLKKTSKTFDAPLAIIVCADHEETWKRSYDGKDSADIDASIITDHMMLQAEELGLGSVWVCSFDPEILRKEFKIPSHVEPVNILIIGYPEGNAPSENRHDKTRKRIEETVFYETF